MYNDNEEFEMNENKQETIQEPTPDFNNSNASVVPEQKIEYITEQNQFENQWQPNSGNFYYGNEEQHNQNIRPKKTKVKKEKKPVTGGKLFMTGLASSLVAVLVSGSVFYYIYTNEIEDKYALKSQLAASTIGSTLDNVSAIISETSSSDNVTGALTTTQITEAVMPSVVSITSTSIVESNYNPFFNGGTYQVTGAGSGIIVGVNDTELLIVTNNHVIADTTSLSVEFTDGKSIDSAYVKGSNSTNDVAIVAVKLEDLDEDTMNVIKVATLGDSEKLQVGENVVAIGNALGYGQSVTQGVVSALDRDITIDANEMTVIQTDASINGGNSGGALINQYGEVIGINVAKASSSSSASASVEGMGYAIPISSVKEIITELMNKETKTEVAEDERGYMGLTSCVDVDDETSTAYNIPIGVYIKEMVDGSPIADSGISVNDVITHIDGQSVASYEEIKEVMKYYAAGDQVTLTVQVRDKNKYTEKEFTFTLLTYDDLEELANN